MTLAKYFSRSSSSYFEVAWCGVESASCLGPSALGESSFKGLRWMSDRRGISGTSIGWNRHGWVGSRISFVDPVHCVARWLLAVLSCLLADEAPSSGHRAWGRDNACHGWMEWDLWNDNESRPLSVNNIFLLREKRMIKRMFFRSGSSCGADDGAVSRLMGVAVSTPGPSVCRGVVGDHLEWVMEPQTDHIHLTTAGFDSTSLDGDPTHREIG